VLAPSASWLFRVSLSDLRRHLWDGAAFGADLQDRTHVQLVGRILSPFRASPGGQRALLPGRWTASMSAPAFRGIGSSPRGDARLAGLNPAMLMIMFTLALIAGSISALDMAEYMSRPRRWGFAGSRLGPGNARVDHGWRLPERSAFPVGQSGKRHLELHQWCMRAMVLEYRAATRP